MVGQWSSFRSQVLEQAARFPVAEWPVRCIAQLVLRLMVEREAVFFDVAVELSRFVSESQGESLSRYRG